MDADTRHQLKSNELAEALGKLQNLRDPRILYSLVGLGVLIVLVAGVFIWRSATRSASEKAWRELDRVSAALATADPNTASTADIQAFITEHEGDSLAEFGRLRLARVRVDQAMLHPEQRPAGFEEAAKLLESIRASAHTPTSLYAAATYMLASTYESLRRPQEAEKLYQQLTTEARFAGTPHRDLASNRLETMQYALAQVTFDPNEPPPQPQQGGPKSGMPDFSKLDLPPEIRAQLEQQQVQVMPVSPEERAKLAEGDAPAAQPEEAPPTPPVTPPTTPPATPPAPPQP
jgi:hypothetical protein